MKIISLCCNVLGIAFSGVVISQGQLALGMSLLSINMALFLANLFYDWD